jgi:hypothetical protein
MFFRLGLGLLWAGLAGFLFVSTLLFKAGSKRSDFWLRVWLGIGCGFGIASLHYFCWRLLADPARGIFIISEIVVLLVLLAVYVRVRPATWSSIKNQLNLENYLNRTSLLGVVFSIVVGFSLLTHIVGFLKKPYGGWDAWMIWNLQARFLFRGSEHWQNLFFPEIAHPDYPLMIAGNVSRLWSIIGKETIFAPAIIGAIYPASILGLLVSAVRYLRDSKLAYIAGFALLGSAGFHFHAPTQSSDFPLSLYILGILILINLKDSSEQSSTGFLVLAGVLTGLATWTKNEGWLVLASLILVRSLQAFFQRSQIRIWHEARSFFTGLIPVAAVVIFYKLNFAPKNDLLAALGPATLDKLMDINRYTEVAKEFLTQSISLNPKFSTPFALLPLLFLFFGVRNSGFRRPGVVTGLLFLTLMFGGYAIVFITTPFRLEWHLYTANARLFLQLWPSAVFIVTLLLGEHQEPVSSWTDPKSDDMHD